MGSLGSSVTVPVSLPASLPLGFSIASTFTFHRHGPFHRSVVHRIAVLCVRSVSVALANFELHEIRWVDAGITRRTKLAFGVIHSLAQSGKRDVTERIRTKELANFFGRIRGGDEFFARRRVHAVVARRNGRRTADAHVNFTGAGFAHHTHYFAAG